MLFVFSLYRTRHQGAPTITDIFYHISGALTLPITKDVYDSQTLFKLPGVWS
jgi:hypothetical protein